MELDQDKSTMRLKMKTTIASLSMFVVVCASAPARAQGEQGAVVGGTAAAANLESRVAFAFGGTVGYQFTRIVAMEIEATAVPTLKQSASESSVLGRQVARFERADGRAVFFTTNVRIQLPTTTARLTPFFVAGGGGANVRRSVDVVVPLPVVTPPLGVILPVPLPRSIAQRVALSMNQLALTIGGGLDVRLAPHVSVNAELRYYRLLGQQDSNVGRFGAGIRYRF